MTLLQERHPNLRVRLQEAITKHVMAMVRRDLVEIVIASRPKDSPDLAAEPLFCDRILAVMPMGHSLASGPVPLGRAAASLCR